MSPCRARLLAAAGHLLAAAAVVTLASCAPAATASGGDSGSDLVLRIEIRNNYPTAVSREVLLAEAGGSPRRIGSVPAGSTRTLDARSVDFGQQHTLAAQSLTGDLVESELFVAAPGSRVVWELGPNRLRIIEP